MIKFAKLVDRFFTLDKILAYLFSVVMLVFLSITFFNAETSYDLGDGIRHFLISKYAWKHPHLFLDSWGKPFFTLVSSLFAQMDLKGIIFFNTLCAVFTAWIAYLILKQLNLKFASPIIILVITVRGYFPYLNSGLTEPFFGLILMLCILLAIRKQFVLSSIIISFLPFVRTEGYLIIVIFALLFLFKKRYIELLLLGTGTLIYSIVGYIVIGDFLWIVHLNPYNGEAKEIYGHGTITHFFEKYQEISGGVLLILATLALIIFIFQFRKKEQSTEFEKLKVFFFLACLSLFIYFGAHVIMWWKGWANSLGLVRPIAAVLPCLALFSYWGFYQLIQLLTSKKIVLQLILIAVGAFYLIKKPLSVYYFPFKVSLEDKVLIDATKWLKAKNYDENLIYYGYPYLGYLIGKDIFDQNQFADLWALPTNIKFWGVNAIPEGTIIIWDSHFGPECKVSTEQLNKVNEFRHLGTFNSLTHERDTKLGYFELSIFKKSKFALKNTLQTKSSTFSAQNSELKNNHLIAQKNEIASEPLAIYSEKDEFGPIETLFSKDLDQIVNKVNFKTAILNIEKEPLELVAVMTAYDENNNVIDWQGKPLKLNSNNSKQFEEISLAYFFNPTWANKANYRIEFYIWNKNKKHFYQKKMELVY